jgi:hypothetical protein
MKSLQALWFCVTAPNTSFQRTSGLACGQPCRR